MRALLAKLVSGATLSEAETYQLFTELLIEGDGAPTDGQIGSLLTAFGVRLPTASEFIGAARSLRDHMIPLETGGLPKDAIVLDTCGTGGSGLSAFNTSTVVALIAAESGVFVPKHGNRALTSRSGSADVLEVLGVRLDLKPNELVSCLRETGFAFLFAPLFHPATRRVQGIRKELGFRTIFNFLGPLVNPAKPRYQLLGVSEPRLLRQMAEALSGLGVEKGMVVCGEDGLDEITATGNTAVCEFENGIFKEYRLHPSDFGLQVAEPEAIQGASPKETAEIIRQILAGGENVRRGLVLLNAGAALYVCGKVPTIAEGVRCADQLLASGKILHRLECLVRFSESHNEQNKN